MFSGWETASTALAASGDSIMKFTTLDENQHLNQPIHFCSLATLRSPRARLNRPFPGPGHTHTSAGPQGRRLSQRAGLWGWWRGFLPGPRERKGCIQKPVSSRNADPTGQITTVPGDPFHGLLPASCLTSTCTCRKVKVGSDSASGGSVSRRWEKTAAWNLGSAMPSSSSPYQSISPEVFTTCARPVSPQLPYLHVSGPLPSPCVGTLPEKVPIKTLQTIY